MRVRVETGFRVQTAVFGDDERSRRCDTRVNVAASATHPQLLQLRPSTGRSTLRLLPSLPCSLTSTFLLLKRLAATQTKKYRYTRRSVSTRSPMSEARHAPRAHLPDLPPPYPGWHNIRPRRVTICAPRLGRINGRGVVKTSASDQWAHAGLEIMVRRHYGSGTGVQRGCTGARDHRWRELLFKDTSEIGDEKRRPSTAGDEGHCRAAWRTGRQSSAT